MNSRVARGLLLGILLLAISPAVALASSLGGEAPSCCCHGSCPKPTDLMPAKAAKDCCEMSDGIPQAPIELPALQTTRSDDSAAASIGIDPTDVTELPRSTERSRAIDPAPPQLAVPLYTQHASLLI